MCVCGNELHFDLCDSVEVQKSIDNTQTEPERKLYTMLLLPLPFFISSHFVFSSTAHSVTASGGERELEAVRAREKQRERIVEFSNCSSGSEIQSRAEQALVASRSLCPLPIFPADNEQQQQQQQRQ